MLNKIASSVDIYSFDRMIVTRSDKNTEIRPTSWGFKGRLQNLYFS